MLDACRDHHVVRACDHTLGREVGGLLRRPALPVDGGARHRLGEARSQGRVAGDVETLGPGLHDAAHDHVLDQRGVEVVALDESLQGLGREVNGVPVLQLPVALASGGADGVDDHGSRHGPAPWART